MKDIKQLALLCAMGLSGALLIGCSVEQTEEGELPDVDVTAEGGKMPAYDVDTADVDVGTREATVDVPKVDVYTEEEQVTVPTVDIDMPEDSEDPEVDDGNNN